MIEEDVKRFKNCLAKTQLYTQQKTVKGSEGFGHSRKAIYMRNIEVRHIISPTKWKKLFQTLCVAI